MPTINSINNSPTQFNVQVGGGSSNIADLGSLGASGQVLISKGAGNNPQWLGPSMTWINTKTASNSASVSFTSSDITTTYNNYIILMYNIVPATAAAYLKLQLSTNNGSTYISTGYQAANFGIGFGIINSDTTCFFFSDNISFGNDNATPYIVVAQLYNLTSGTTPMCNSIMTASRSSSQTVTVSSGGVYTSNVTVNNFQLFMSTGNITSGTFHLYGIH